MPKNDLKRTFFVNFEGVVHNFGRSDETKFSEKMLVFN